MRDVTLVIYIEFIKNKVSHKEVFKAALQAHLHFTYNVLL